jgi:lauroyl/myristoyl acyltransferase
MRGDIPIIMVTITREPDGSHVTRIFPEFQLIRTGDRNRDLTANLQHFVDVFQEEVVKHADQYYWQYPRWRTRPDGTSYPKRAAYEHEVANERVTPPFAAPVGW